MCEAGAKGVESIISKKAASMTYSLSVTCCSKVAATAVLSALVASRESTASERLSCAPEMEVDKALTLGAGGGVGTGEEMSDWATGRGENVRRQWRRSGMGGGCSLTIVSWPLWRAPCQR
jgi:hypothetical protein